MRAALRRGLIGVVVLIGLFVAAAGVVPTIVDVDRLRPQAESRLSAALGREVTLGPLRLSLWAGPSVGADGLQIAGEPTVQARRARIHLALWPLLGGEVQPRAVEIDDGRVLRRSQPLVEAVSIRSRVLRRDGAPVRLTGRLEGRAIVTGEPSNVAVVYDAFLGPGRLELTAVTATVGAIVVEGRGELRRNGSGDVAADLEGDARIAGLALRRLRAAAEMGGGSIRLDTAEFEIYGGTGTASGSLRWDEPGLPYAVVARIAGARVEGIVEAMAPLYGDVIEGAVTVTVEVEGMAAAGSRSTSLRGPVTGEIVDGTLKSVALLKQAARLIEMAGGRGIGRDETPFHRIAASFIVRDAVATTDAMTFRSADLDLDGGGAVGLDGGLRLDVVSSFSRDASAQLVEHTPQLRFRVDPSGRLTLPMKIRGTLRSPVVQIDIDRVLQEGLQQELRRQGRKGWLRQLLGRN